MRLADRNLMIKAMQECDASYDGDFYVGVISTGIYCLPSCKAKLPKIENVHFFPTREDAIAAGLRGCKRCRSESFPDVLPEWLPAIIDYMKKHSAEKLNESTLTGLSGTDITTIRRYFRDHLETTPMAFHRRLRLNRARDLLNKGHDFFTVALEAGYESSSGFQEAFVKEFGSTPKELNGIK